MAPIDTASLAQLLARAAADQREEPIFFRALLDAPIYAHAPRGDAARDRLQFIQFPHPQTGQLLLPFFTDQNKALIAAGDAVQLVAMTGRQLMELTRGATLILNPNDECCLLYPEEVATLLRTGTLARIDQVTDDEAFPPEISILEHVPDWLRECVTTTLSELPFVVQAYLVALHHRPGESSSGLLLVLGTKPTYGERAARAMIEAVQALCAKHGLGLNLTVFDVPGTRPPWIETLGITPLYERWTVDEAQSKQH